ncbi:hypothetical protein [Streptomyces sp. NPDC057702]|uniref:hypothetical protein n=1 Tax=Streptomyces sp. NPDC057702 TaxID=3346221 RepID=UPI00367DD350
MISLDTPIGWVTADPVRAGTIAASALLMVTVVLVTARKMPRPLAGIGPQAVVALGGVAVSVHGLWAFAVEVAALPRLLAVGFISVFDLAEMTLLAMMYRQADPATGWTPELRLMHRTAWLLVAFSCAMNAIHAPSWWARPVLGAIPALAAWLIELKLRAKLHDPQAEADQDARPGPLRLVVLGWQHLWAGIFAVLGLDAAGRGSSIARAALAQRAAHASYRLRLALETRAALGLLSPRAKKRADAQVERRRRAAQRALDRADIATDSAQALSMARRMAALTGVDGVAQLAYDDAERVMSMLEGLAVVPAAEHITASTRALEAEDARQRAESARQEAETARHRAAEETEAAQQRLEEITKAVAEAAQGAEDAREEAERVEAARQRAEAARQEAEAARQRAIDAREEAERRTALLRTEAQTLQERLERLDGERGSAEQRADGARHERAEMQEALGLLRGELADLSAARERATEDLARATATTERAREQAATLVAQSRDLAHRADQHRKSVTEAEAARGEAQRAAQAAAQEAERCRAELAAAQTALERVRGELAAHTTPGPVPDGSGRVFESDAKQRGYEHYRALSRAGRAEPRAVDLAARFGVSEGNARNWVRDFRATHARELVTDSVLASDAVSA